MSYAGDRVSSEELAATCEPAERFAREVQQVFAEAVREYELHSPLTEEQREQTEVIIKQAMDSVRNMVAGWGMPKRQ